MRNAVKFLLVILIAAAVSYGVSHRQTQQAGITPPAETAFDRVLRTNVVRCAYVNWPPYFVKDPNSGNISGMNVDIMNEISKELDVKVEWAEEVGWGNLTAGLATGRYDAVCTGAWPDGAKMKHALMSEPLAYSVLHAYVRTDDNRFNGNIESINSPDVKIVVIDGGSSYTIAKNRFPKATLIGVPPLSSNAEWFLYVQGKKADVVITDQSESQSFMNANPGVLKKVSNVPPVRIMPLQLTFDKNENELATRFNQAISMLHDNGIIEQIVKKYSQEYLFNNTRYRD